jgi:Leucine-rich repeat (LRR) protein
MKKWILFSLLFTQIALGQQKIFRTDVFEKNVMNQVEGVRKYIPIFYINGLVGTQDVMKTNKEKADFLEKLLAFFDNQGLKLHHLNESFLDYFTFYASKNGAIDYVTFGYKKDSRNEQVQIDTLKSYNFDLIEATLQKFLVNNKFSDQISDTPFQIAYALQIGKIKKNEEGDGFRTIEQLEKCTDFNAIKTLNFNLLYLEKFPSIILKCKNLEELDLADNLLKTIPRSVLKLKKLKLLNLKGNPLVHEKLKFKRNKHLLILNCQQTKMTKMNPTLKRNKRLEVLLLSKNKLESLKDKDFKGFKNLETLSLYDVNLSKLPVGIKYLKSLRELDLYHNHLRLLPKEIGQLSNLRTLAVSFNELWKIPEEIISMSNLKVLYIHHNKLDFLADLPNLTHLDIGYNAFRQLPASIFKIETLQEFDFIGNQLAIIPNEILAMPNLKRVYLNNNDFLKNKDKMLDYKAFIEALESKGIKVF